MEAEHGYSYNSGGKGPFKLNPVSLELTLLSDNTFSSHGKGAFPLEGVLNSIRTMTAKVRMSQGLFEQTGTGEGWWVLAVGDDLEGAPFEARDIARDILRQQVETAGVLLAEYVWVWDDAKQAQLVVATFPSLERARRVAERLRTKGLKIRVARETL